MKDAGPGIAITHVIFIFLNTDVVQNTKITQTNPEMYCMHGYQMEEHSGRTQWHDLSWYSILGAHFIADDETRWEDEMALSGWIPKTRYGYRRCQMLYGVLKKCSCVANPSHVTARCDSIVFILKSCTAQIKFSITGMVHAKSCLFVQNIYFSALKNKCRGQIGLI